MTVYDFEVKTIRGETQSLREYAGNVLLIVNTATKCGFAPQFFGLQKLHDEFKDRGFAVLGFPCSQFANQEEEQDSQIAQVCERNLGVTFPMFAKIDVNGPNAHPLFKHLSETARGILGSKRIKWNFTKFLVDRKGQAVKRFGPNVAPEQIADDIQKLLTD